MQPGAAFDSGFFAAAIDEADNTPPTVAILKAPHLDMSCADNASSRRYSIDWMPASTSDLNWTQTAAPVDFAWLKIFSQPATTFTGAAQISKLIVTGTVTLCVRQFKE